MIKLRNSIWYFLSLCTLKFNFHSWLALGWFVARVFATGRRARTFARCRRARGRFSLCATSLLLRTPGEHWRALGDTRYKMERGIDGFQWQNLLRPPLGTCRRLSCLQGLVTNAIFIQPIIISLAISLNYSGSTEVMIRNPSLGLIIPHWKSLFGQ